MMQVPETSTSGGLAVPQEGELRRMSDGSWEIWLVPSEEPGVLAELEGQRVHARLVLERVGGVDRVLGEIDGHRVGVVHRTVAGRLVLAVAGGAMSAGRVALARRVRRYRLTLAVTVPPGAISRARG